MTANSRRRSRAREVLKWFGITMSIITSIAMMLTTCLQFSWNSADGSYEIEFAYGYFLVVIVHDPDVRALRSLSGGWIFGHEWQGIRIPPPSIETTWGPSRTQSNARLLTMLQIPIWMVCAFAIVPTAWAMWRDRDRPPGQCQHCGYNLTGNVSGRCPECGEDVNAV